VAQASVSDLTTLGVLADTHIPDRARRLDPRVISIFSAANVDAILHAGDVSAPWVLKTLGQVAPVHAVRGNRDWWLLRELPTTLELEFSGVSIGMAHGHGSWLNYFSDRFYLLFHTYRHELLLPRLKAAFPHTRVIVFGHGHLPLNCWSEGRLLFNPGSPHFPQAKNITPSVGLLHITAGGDARGEIVPIG
jgi:putative phosphoesterase